MSPEITALALALLLQAVQFVLMAVPTNLEVGTGKTLSPRDKARLGGELTDQVSPRTARLIRAMNNHFEALVLFGGAVLVVELSGRNSSLTAACAWVYLGARVLYIPAYAFGWVPWRSLIWCAGFLASVVMVLAALFGT